MTTNYKASKHIAAFAILTLAAPLQAGVVNEVLVMKERFCKQTNATTVQLQPADDYPFGFSVELSGANNAALAALMPKPTITLPAIATFATTYGVTPALGLDDDGDEWTFGYIGKESFDNWGTKTKAELDAVLPKGKYTLRMEGKVVNLYFPNNIYPTAPKLTLSGGFWSNGSYKIRSNKALTINSGTYAAYGTNLNNFLFVGMEQGFGNEEEIFDHVQLAKSLAFAPPQSSANFYVRKILANTLSPGTYYVYAGYGAVGSISTALPGALAISGMITETEVKVVVLPPL